MKKNEIKKAIRPSLLSENSDPNSLLQEPGDYVIAKVTKKNRRVMIAKNHYGKRSITKYPNGKIVETISY